MFSITVRFQPLIMVGWMSYLLASSAVVSSSRMAYRATSALNSAESRFRLVISLRSYSGATA